MDYNFQKGNDGNINQLLYSDDNQQDFENVLTSYY